MKMTAWAKHLDRIIVATGDELLTRASEISMEIAQAKAIAISMNEVTFFPQELIKLV